MKLPDFDLKARYVSTSPRRVSVRAVSSSVDFRSHDSQPCAQFFDTAHAMWEGRIASAYQAGATNSFGNLPLIVIARDPLYYIMLRDKPERPEWEPQFARA